MKMLCQAEPVEDWMMNKTHQAQVCDATTMRKALQITT
jgi:hypothetical protein